MPRDMTLVHCNPSKQRRIGVQKEFDGSGWNRLKMKLSYYLVSIQVNLFSIVVVIFKQMIKSGSRGLGVGIP